MTEHPNLDLDAAIGSAPSTEEQRVQVMNMVIKSVLVLPSSTPATDMGSVTPVMFPPARYPSVSVFTTAEGASKVAHVAPYQLTMTGFDLVTSLAPTMGLAVVGVLGVVVFDPELLTLVRQDLFGRGES